VSEHHIPKGVSLETLQEIVTGWASVGAAVEPQYTSAVEDATGISDAVGRQTRFLEEIEVLNRVGQRHELTDTGLVLAGALVAENSSLAAEQARRIPMDWELTADVRGVVRQNPMSREDLVPVVASLAGVDPDTSRARSGITTVLDLFEWSHVLVQDDSDRYRPADRDDAERLVGDPAATERRMEKAADDGRADTSNEDSQQAGGDSAREHGEAPAGAERTGSVRDTLRPSGPEPPALPEPASTETARGQMEDASVVLPAIRLDCTETDKGSPVVEFVPLSDGGGSTDVGLSDVAEAVVTRIDASTENRAESEGADPGGGDTERAASDTQSDPTLHDHSLSLGVDVDADAADLESIVAAIRNGLIEGAER
jgi:hypothetical protein